MKKGFTDEQAIVILREAEIGAMTIKAPCRKHNILAQRLGHAGEGTRLHHRRARSAR